MRTPPRATRRALLAGVGAAALAGPLAACDVPGPTRRTSTDGRPDASGNTSADPDARHVSTAVGEAESLLAFVLAVGSAHPTLTATTAPLAECHRRHLDVLGARTPTPSSAPTSPVSPSPVPTSPVPTSPPSGVDGTPTPLQVPKGAGRALRQVLAREQAHAATLGAAALAAESGALARLMASMAAGVQMHLAMAEEGPQR